MPVDRSRLPDVGPDPAFTFPGIARHTLANGLHVRTVEHHTCRWSRSCCRSRAAPAPIRPAREGLAAITADMVDEGTGVAQRASTSPTRSPGSAPTTTSTSGPTRRSFTLTTLTRFAEQRRLAARRHRCSGRACSEPDFDRVRQLRLDRLRQLKDLPPAVAERAFLRAAVRRPSVRASGDRQRRGAGAVDAGGRGGVSRRARFGPIARDARRGRARCRTTSCAASPRRRSAAGRRRASGGAVDRGQRHRAAGRPIRHAAGDRAARRRGAVRAAHRPSVGAPRHARLSGAAGDERACSAGSSSAASI